MWPSSQSGGLTIGMHGTARDSRSKWPYKERVRARASRSAAPRPPSYNRAMGRPAKPVVCIVTPGSKEANNGNWRTAARWAGMLRNRYRIILQSEWDGNAADALIAL